MTVRRLAALQWFGLLAGGAVWWAQHLIGLGITQAECAVGGRSWGIDNTTWQATTTAVSAVLILIALAAAIVVFLRTGDSSYDGVPPQGRIRFFAIAAMPVNVLMLMIVLLDGVASIVDSVCRPG
jgi:hypothetical protein